MTNKSQVLNIGFFLEKAVRWLLYAALFTPLIVSSVFYFPFIFSKTIFFRTIIELAFFFYFLLAALKPEYRFHFSKIAGAGVIYLGAVIISSIFGFDLYRSFWGDTERGEGILLLLHLAAFFVMLGGVFTTKQDWRRFFYVSVFSGFLVSAYSIIQFIIPNFGFRTGTGARFAGTVGNPSFLAAYLLFTMFLALWLFFNPSEEEVASKIKKIFSAIFLSASIVCNFFVIFNTQTRGAVLAALFGFFLLAVAGIFSHKNIQIKKAAIVAIIVLLFMPLAVWFGKNQNWVKNNPTLNRLATISLEDITTASRFEVWKVSLKVWRDNFWLGAGYENFNLVFNGDFPPKIFRDQGSQLWFDRAHNIVFDITTTTGSFGLVAYLLIFASASYAFWFSSKENFFASRFFIIILAVYFFQNLFVFDTVSSHMMFAAVLAFAHFEEKDRTAVVQTASGKSLQLSFFSFLTLVVIFSFVIYFVNVRSALANYYAAQAIRGERDGWKYDDVLNYFRRSLSYGEYQQADIRQRLSETILLWLKNQKFPNDQLSRSADFAIEEIQKNLKNEPMNVKYYLTLMSLYNSSDYFDEKRLERVEEIGQIALKLSPTRPHTYFELAQTKMSLKKYDEGVVYFKKAIELNDQPFEPHWNLAAAYLTIGREDLADEEFKKSEERGLNYDTVNNLLKIGYISRIAKNYPRLVDSYERLVKLQPNNADFYSKLAASYQLIGDNSKAAAAAKKAGELDPSYKQEADVFIQSLRVK